MNYDEEGHQKNFFFGKQLVRNLFLEKVTSDLFLSSLFSYVLYIQTTHHDIGQNIDAC